MKENHELDGRFKQKRHNFVDQKSMFAQDVINQFSYVIIVILNMYYHL